MKKSLIVFTFFLFANYCSGQSLPPEYYDLIGKAETFYMANNFKASAQAYSDAFKVNGWKGLSSDRYDAACSWALAGVPDSAFLNLERIVSKANFTDVDRVVADHDLDTLHTDKRWQSLLAMMNAAKEKAEANLNKPLAHQLDSIEEVDQQGRLLSEEYEKKYGNDSKEMRGLWTKINNSDSTNLIAVEAILAQYGWLGPDIIGEKGNSTLFLVIQHADLKTQEKYLPMMREAVTKGNARGSDIALLIDRVEMRNNRPQVYGSQIVMKNGKYEVYSIIDEPNVNKRREEVGLGPIENYVRHWNINYNVPAK